MWARWDTAEVMETPANAAKPADLLPTNTPAGRGPPAEPEEPRERRCEELSLISRIPVQ